MTTSQTEQWQGHTDGFQWMHRLLIRSLAVLPLGLVYGIAALLVVPVYMLVRREAYRVQYRLFRQCFGEAPLRAFCHVYLNFYRFSQVIIDRFAVYGGRRYEFQVEGLDLYNQLAEGEGGFMQICSHCGNYELAGYELRQPRKVLYMLLFSGETQTVMQNRARVLAPNGVQLVPFAPDMSHIFTLNNALADGNIVSMAGDRIFGSAKSISCQFFGRTVRLPMGPFSLASARQVPVVTIFVMKEGWHRYRIYVCPLTAIPASADDTLPRISKQALAQQYATELEQMLRRYPEQWFNYFDLWQ